MAYRVSEQLSLPKVNKAQDIGMTGHISELPAVPGLSAGLAICSHLMLHHSASLKFDTRAAL
jgi:hypothetical protein